MTIVEELQARHHRSQRGERMTIAEEIEHRIHDLQERTWVNHAPRALGESCLMYDWDMMGFPPRSAFSAGAAHWLETWTWAHYRLIPISWNDHKAKGLDEMLSMLKDAWRSAFEEGV